MLIDHRTYTVRPGTLPAQLEVYSKLGYPVQLRYMGEPHYYMMAESGELNTLVHGWIYESAADREAKRARMAQDPDWKHYLSENAKAGNVVQQRNVLMVPVGFAPKIPPAKIVK
ncbi:MAG TPA: NIPSNAP family protein [Pseudolabrys sp.]|nr:NIPSNAP family protein [Pseudolabrys sp.]